MRIEWQFCIKILFLANTNSPFLDPPTEKRAMRLESTLILGWGESLLQIIEKYNLNILLLGYFEVTR